MSVGKQNTSYQPVIIIGAARSGTNMLRDCMTSLEPIGSWPCDEINLIWRHGNHNFPSDEFTPKQATPKIKNYIQGVFNKFANQHNLDYVVEKTCANSVRVPFVDSVIPNAKYIYIVRDGRDASSSAMKRWKASVELPYLLKKLRYTPISDIPVYGKRFIQNRIHQYKNKEKRQFYWGPRIAELERNIGQYSLAEICARQWVETVKSSEAAFATLPDDRVCHTTYEKFIENPNQEMKKILSFIEYDISDEQIAESVSSVRSGYVGQWRKNLAEEEQDVIVEICAPMLEKLGYSNDK